MGQGIGPTFDIINSTIINSVTHYFAIDPVLFKEVVDLAFVHSKTEAASSQLAEYQNSNKTKQHPQ